MLLVKPSVEILRIDEGALEHIETAGRTCYQSWDRVAEGSAEKFVTMLLSKNHGAMLEHAYATVRFVCDRGVSHEIVRHRIASYAQESTRYCNYGKMGIKYIIPSDFELDEADLALLTDIENHYNKCLEMGRTPQQARYFLPNGLKTELVMTANFREWRNFFSLRLPKEAHPDMRWLAGELWCKMQERVPVVFAKI